MDLLIYQNVDKQNLSLFQRLISSVCRLGFKRWLLTLSIVLERFSEILYAEPQISLDTLGVTVSCFAFTFVRDVKKKQMWDAGGKDPSAPSTPFSPVHSRAQQARRAEIWIERQRE